MRAQITTRDYEQLSAYLDGQLSPTEQTRLEERLRANPELRTALEEMNRTRTLIRMAPRRRAPRNFTLTPSMVQPRQTRPRGILNLFPALSFASAIATLALVLSFLFELSPGVTTLTMTEAARESTVSLLQRGGESPAESAPGAGDTSFAAPEITAQDAGKAPPAITWGFPSSPDMGVGGMGGGPGVVDGRGGGMGGFPENTVQGVGGGAPDGSIVVPPEGVASLEDEESAGTLENNADQFADVPRIEGSGPILGAPQPEEAGQIIEQPLTSSSPTTSEPIPSAPEEDSATGAGTGTSDVFGMPALRFIQVLLGGLAVITGLAALFIWRRAR